MPESNWTAATKLAVPAICIHCGNDDPRLLEFHAGVWLCIVCSRSWKAS